MGQLNKKACKDIKDFKGNNGDTVLLNLMYLDSEKMPKAEFTERLIERTKYLEQKAENLKMQEKHNENEVFKKGDYETADDIYLDIIKQKLNIIKYT